MTSSPSVRAGRHPLERLLSPHDPRGIDDPAPVGTPVWLHARGWRLFATPDRGPRNRGGEPFERFELLDGAVVEARIGTGGAVALPFNLREAHDNFVSERWRLGLPNRGLSARQLDAYYRVKKLIPRPVQLAARRALAGRTGLPEFPAWPLEESFHRLLQFYARCVLLAGSERELSFDWFWPAPFRAAAILTHDVESAEGLRLAVELADREEERGLRSSFNVVARGYPIDDGILAELRERGFELGVHGVYHDRSLFSSRTEFEAQLPLIRDHAERLAASGFRSPATHRVFDWLGDLPVDYDCSVPHSDPFEPIPGGACSLWPFFVGDVVELPYTLPQDHTLFTVLGQRSISLWRDQLDRIEQLNGLAELVTHPDPGYLGEPWKRALYLELLDLLLERPALWKPLPRELAVWWRQRDAGQPGPLAVGRGRASLAGDGSVAFELQAA